MIAAFAHTRRMTPNAPQRALPTLFLSHGSPMIAIEPGEAGAFMRRLGPRIDATFGRPQAIVVMSPHTSSRIPQVMAAEQHTTLHDFGGFPPALYALRYDAPGDVARTRQVTALLKQAGIDADMSSPGGLDHGIWTVLMHLYPACDVPVVPVSLTPRSTPAQLMAMGAALSTLRQDGVLVVGSGSLTHNLQRFFHRPTPVDAPEEADSAAFRAWVAKQTAAGDWPALLDYRHQAPHAVAMHPTDEHWLPFYFAAGAACEAGEACPHQALRLHGSVTHGHLAMDAHGFGEGAELLRE